MAARVNVVLGGDGLIGKALCEEIVGRGDIAISLDIKSGFDLRSQTLSHLANIDRIWFLAWEVGGWKYLSSEQAQHEIYLNNCLMCSNVFNFLWQTKVPFLFVSSQMAGGFGAYGDTKLLAEKWTRHLGGKIVRLWNVYGWEMPGLRSHVIPDLVLSGLRGKVECGSDGKERRQFIYKSDCARGLVDIFDLPDSEYDLTSEVWTPISDVAKEIARQLKVDVTFGDRPGYENIINPTHLPAGWIPSLALPEGIAQVIEEAKAQLQDEDRSPKQKR